MTHTLYKIALFCLIALCLGRPAQAQERLAVLELQAKGGIEQEQANILTDRLRTLLVRNGNLEIIERDSIDQILKEQGFQSTQICDDANCSVQIGRILAVPQILIGSVSKLDRLHSINVRLIDVGKGVIQDEFYVDCFCSIEELLLKQLPILTEQISASYRDEPVTQATPKPTPRPSARPSTRPEPPTPDNISVRKSRPHLIYLDGSFAGVSNVFSPSGVFGSTLQGSTQLGYLYQINPHFALGGFGGLTSRANATITGTLGLQARYYFNPDPWAWFVDGGLQVTSPFTTLIPHLRPGIEYRGESGLTVGAFLDLQLAISGALGAGLYAGYAF